MTRRILFMLLGFTAIVLVGAVVPLTLSTIGQDRNSFIQDTQAMANADASVAQPRFVLRKPAEARPVDFDLLLVYKQVEQAGDGLVIYLTDGRLLDAKGKVPTGQWRNLAAQVADTAQAFTGTMGSRSIAAVPVFNPGTIAGPVLGTVILVRSTAPLEREIVKLWVLFGTICAVAMIAAALLGFGLARWEPRA